MRYFIIITAALTLSNCGVEDTKNADVMTESQGRTSTSEINEDTSIASEDISSQAASALNSVINLDTAEAANLLFGLIPSDQEEQERDCVTEKDGSVIVNISRDRDRKITKVRNSSSIAINGSKTAKITRNWKKPNTTLTCNTEETHIALKPEDLAATSLTATFERESSQFIEVTKKNGSIFNKNRSKKSSGTRNITFNGSSVVDGIVTINKSVTLDITASFTRLNKDGLSKTVDTNIITANDAPLVVEVTRNQQDKSWLARKIISGTTIGKNSDGGRIELTYTNALFTKDGECTPTSGTLDGSIYTTSESTLAEKTFTVDFGTEIKTITFSDGSTKEMEIADCGFSKPQKKTIKKVKKINQKAKKAITRKSSKDS